MRTLTYTMLSLVLLVCLSCDRSDDLKLVRTPLIGKWRVAEFLADPGDGSGKWTPVPESAKLFVEFKPNGKLEGNVYGDYKYYTVKDSVTLTFTGKNMEVQHYSFGIKDDVLTMSPAGPIMCIEGCGTRFVKVE